MNTFEIDDLLEKMAQSDIQHFSPYYICHQLNIEDLSGVTNYLLELVNKKLVVHYEVECPEGHNDFIVEDPKVLPKEPRECGICGTEYVPDLRYIWVAFDFTHFYKEHVKKKVAQGCIKESFLPPANERLLEFDLLKELPTFKERESLLALYTPDLRELESLLTFARKIHLDYRQQLSDRGRGQKPKTNYTSKEVGDAFEKFCNYLFSCTNEILIPHGPWANDMSQIDDILKVTCKECFLVKWPPFSLVECKNWGHPLGKQGVNDFISKLRDSKQHVGIIFSREGITGEEYTDAKGKVVIAASHGQIVLILTDEDLDALISGKNLFDLLEKKYFETQLSSA